MTIRTGKSGRYRYYTCSIKARQGETGCKGRSIPMPKLDDLVAEHLETRCCQTNGNLSPPPRNSPKPSQPQAMTACQAASAAARLCL